MTTTVLHNSVLLKPQILNADMADTADLTDNKLIPGMTKEKADRWAHDDGTDWAGDMTHGDTKRPGGCQCVLKEDFEVVGVTVGNVTDGTIIPKGSNLTDILNQILKKEIAPTYIKPSVSLSVVPPLVEKDANTTVSINVNFSKGDSGGLTENGIDGIGTGSTFTETITGEKTYTAYAKYSDGPIKKDNMGNEYPEGQIKAGMVTTSFTVHSVYPFYYGTTTSPTITQVMGTKDLSEKSNKTYKYTADNKYLFILYDSSYGELTSVMDGYNFENITDFNVYTFNQGNATYRVYITRTKKTCENFQYAFRF